MATVDIRSRAAFALSRVAESVNIPYTDLSERLFELPAKDVPLRVVCDDESAASISTLLQAGWIARSAHASDLVDELGDHSYRSRVWEPADYVIRQIEAIEACTKGRLALDLGCGCGRDAAFLAARGWRVIGVENRLKLAQQARSLALRYTAACADTEAVPRGFHDPLLLQIGDYLPFRDGSFDLVLCVRFLHRPLLPALTRYVARGGHVLYSHFVDGVQLVGTPKHPSGYLLHGELQECLCRADDPERLEIVDNSEAQLADTRPIVNFLAIKPNITSINR